MQQESLGRLLRHTTTTRCRCKGREAVGVHRDATRVYTYLLGFRFLFLICEGWGSAVRVRGRVGGKERVRVERTHGRRGERGVRSDGGCRGAGRGRRRGRGAARRHRGPWRTSAEARRRARNDRGRKIGTRREGRIRRERRERKQDGRYSSVGPGRRVSECTTSGGQWSASAQYIWFSYTARGVSVRP